MEFIFLAIILWVMHSIVKQKRSNKLSRIPHFRSDLPFEFPIVTSLYNLYNFKTGGTKSLEEAAEKSGYVFQIDVGIVRTVVIGDAEVVQKILCSTEPTHLNKPKAVYDLIFIDCFKDGLVNSDFAVWAPHRKMLNRCFTYKCYVHYVKIMNRHARDLAKNIGRLSTPASVSSVPLPLEHGKKVVDMIYFHLVKLISQILMDTDRYADDRLDEFSKNLQAMKQFIIARLLNPQLLFKPYWYFHPMKKQYDSVYSSTKSFFEEMYIECKKDTEAELLEKDSVEDDSGIKPFRCVMKEMISCGATDKEIYDEIGTILGAGHETTVVATQMLLQHLALNPEHQSRCREEVNKMFEGKCHLGNIADDMECDITIDDLANLKYLERCILESGRLTSTVPLFMRRLGSPLKLDKDLELASGTNLAIMPWILHKNPKYYPNPETFDPDRFLPENIKSRHPYAYIPFSGGARNCIGYKVALLQIKMIMIWLLHKYEVRSDDKLEDVRLLFEVTLRPERDFRIKLIPIQ